MTARMFPPMIRAALTLLVAIAALLGPVAPATAQDRPVRIAVARLTHGHVDQLLGREKRGDVTVVGIFEPDRALAKRYVERYGIDPAIVHGALGPMLDAAWPEAVVAFGSIAEHRGVVEAAAPRGVHVMVEKPLAFLLSDAEAMATLARRHRIYLLTNFETTWYPSRTALKAALVGGSVGPLRKAVFRHGHWGPKEIGVSPEFLGWLTDPAANGGGALVDFGCYGINLMTWLMDGQAPTSVTAVLQRTKADPAYARVDDEATLVLTYPRAQAVVQASWNWPDHRKDVQLFGERGLLFAPDSARLTVRRRGEAADAAAPVPALPPERAEPFAFLAAVVRGRVSVADTDPSSLANALTVARVLDAARRSATTGRTVRLDEGR